MYKEYCTGCGLCASIKDVDIEMEKNGFREISFSDNRDGLLEKVCPSGGVQCEQLEPGNIWGREHGVFLSYSLNSSVRKKASSGGVLTTIALYLLDHKLGIRLKQRWCVARQKRKYSHVWDHDILPLCH